MAPTGGPKDIEPPYILKVIPNDTIGFNSKYLQFNFNEYFVLNDVNKNFIISPIINQNPIYKIKNKSLIIIFSDSSLLDSVTYTLKPGISILDNNERNSFDKNYFYRFTKSKTLDNFYLRGSVIDNYTNKPINDAKVLLHTNINSFPDKNSLTYYSKTDENGNFIINSIHKGQYSLIAYTDNNNNFIFDQNSELIGFYEKKIIYPFHYDSCNLKIRLFKEPIYKQKVISAVNLEYGLIILKMAKPIDKNFTISEITNENFIKYVSYSKNYDSVYVWYNDTTTLSPKLYIKTSDFSDTVSINLKKYNNKLINQKINTNLSQTKPFYKNNPIELQFKVPIKKCFLEKIIVTDSINEFIPNIDTFENILTGLKFYLPLEDNKTYCLKIDRGGLIDIYDNFNDTISFTFHTGFMSDLSNLTVNLKVNTSHNIIIELLNKENKLIDNKILCTSSSSTLTFASIPPDTYVLKAIFDYNKNNMFDDGSFLKKIQPEPILIYDKDIIIKPGWDNEIEWDLTKL